MKSKLLKALHFTLDNAESLYSEAELLEKNEFYGRSYSLYHLCFEEAGRFFLIFDLLLKLFSNQIDIKNLNYGYLKKLGYEKHEIKINRSLDGIVSYFLMSKQKIFHGELNEIQFNEIKNELIDFKSRIIDSNNIINKLNELKNRGLYVSFFDNDFHLPSETIKTKEFFEMKHLSETGVLIIQNLDLLGRLWKWY